MSASHRIWIALALVALFAAPSLAQDGGKKKKNAAPPPAVNQLLKKTEGLGLSDEQTKKIQAIAEAYAPKIRVANQQLNTVLTTEQKQARAEAVAKNRADGLKGKDAAAQVEAALALTADQKKTQADAQASLKELVAKMNEEVLAVLTPEQKEKFQPKKPAQ